MAEGSQRGSPNLGPKTEGSEKENVAIMIFNAKYNRQNHHDLPGVLKDKGEMIEMLTAGNYKLQVASNVDDIEGQMKKFSKEMKGRSFKRLHFHYSGHGIKLTREKRKSSNMTNMLNLETTVLLGLGPQGSCFLTSASRTCCLRCAMSAVRRRSPSHWTAAEAGLR